MGAGSGGVALACELAERGVQVLVLEEGPLPGEAGAAPRWTAFGRPRLPIELRREALGSGPPAPRASPLRRGAEALGLQPGPPPAPEPGSELLRAGQAGARIVPYCRVERVLTLGATAAGVEAVLLRDPAPHRLSVGCSVLAVCSGALRTPLLLAQSRLGRDLPALGRNLGLRLAARVLGVLGGRARERDAFLIREFEGEGVVLEVSESVPTSERALTSAAVDVLVAGGAHGRVLRGPGSRPWILYQVRRDEARRLIWGLATAAEILFAAGAEHVHLPVSSHRTLHRPEDIDRFVRSGVRRTQLGMSGRDPAGTCRPGADPFEAVLRPDGELHGLDHLFVADASALAWSPDGPVRIPVQELAARTAEAILQRLGRAASVSASGPGMSPAVVPALASAPLSQRSAAVP